MIATVKSKRLPKDVLPHLECSGASVWAYQEACSDFIVAYSINGILLGRMLEQKDIDRENAKFFDAIHVSGHQSVAIIQGLMTSDAMRAIKGNSNCRAVMNFLLAKLHGNEFSEFDKLCRKLDIDKRDEEEKGTDLLRTVASRFTSVWMKYDKLSTGNKLLAGYLKERIKAIAFPIFYNQGPRKRRRDSEDAEEGDGVGSSGVGASFGTARAAPVPLGPALGVLPGLGMHPSRDLSKHPLLSPSTTTAKANGDYNGIHVDAGSEMEQLKQELVKLKERVDTNAEDRLNARSMVPGTHQKLFGQQ